MSSPTIKYVHPQHPPLYHLPSRDNWVGPFEGDFAEGDFAEGSATRYLVWGQ